jgi:hypothetical protein
VLFTRTLAAGIGLALLAPLAPAPAGAAPAADPVVTDARAWLVSKQKTDGSFEVAGSTSFETPDAVLALAGVAQTGPTWDPSAARAAVESVQNGGKDALDYLDDLADADAGLTTVAAAARAAKLIALVATPLGIDPADFDPAADSAEPVDLVARMDSVKQEDGSYAMPFQFNGVLYTAIALSRAGLPVPEGLLDQIEGGQRSDGTFNYAGDQDPTNPGDVDTTALALIALDGAGFVPTDPVMSDSLGYLADTHQASGAWQSFGADDTNSTSMATLALTALQLDPTTKAWATTFGETAPATYASPLAWIASQQQDDGRLKSSSEGFGLNTFSTSQGIQALSRTWYAAEERDALVAGLADVLATSSGADPSAAALGVASDALGPNPSVLAGQARAAATLLASPPGREAAAADLFQQAFDRAIDPSGRAYWSTKLLTLTRPQMLSRLTGSNEFYRRAGSTTPLFVDAVYQSVLGRPSDPSGKAYWVNVITNGGSREKVARSLVASTEYRRKTVVAAYQLVLGRNPDVGGRDYWTAKLATTRVEVLLRGLAATRSFYLRVTD